MESGKKASIFNDRSAVGSAEELDEYGVWVKSEPEDITFDDSAFPGEIGKAVEVTGIESGFDLDFSGTGTDEASLTSGGLYTSDDSGFDIDFGEEAADAPDELTAGLSAGDIVVEDSGFDVDFGEEAADAPDELTAGLSAGDIVVEDSGFDVDFGEEAADAPDELTAGLSAGDIVVEDSGFDVDFGEEAADAPSELTAGLSAGDVVVEDSGFDVDFGKEAADAPSELTAGLSAGDIVVEDFGFDVDFGEEAADAPSELTAGLSAGDVVVEDSGFDVDFGEEAADAPSELTAGLSAGDVVVEDSGFDVDFGAKAADAPDQYDFEISLDDIPETPQISGDETEAPETGKTAPAQGDPLANELLLRIVSELSTIKAELNSLKEEISTIRGGALESKPATPEPEAAPDNLGAGTLSAVELEAVLNNAEIETVEAALPEDGMIFDDELNLPVESGEVEAEDVTPSAAETPEYYVSVDLDLDETHDEPPTAFDDFSGDFDISENAPAEEIVVPAPDEDDTMPDLVPAAPDYLSPDDLVDINEGPDAGPAMSDAENIPVESQAPAQEPAETESAVQSSHDPFDTPNFKKDLQIVLSYMDRLLEALPDEKIEEFARSEQFDTYKKVFKELGLV